MKEIWGEDIVWSESLWRYLKISRFVWMLESAKLYFAAATQFTDRFEGAAAVLPPDFPIDPRYAEPEQMDQINRRFKRLYKINCWHRAEYESNAMWHLYAGQSKGVAICSTPGRMRAAIKPFRLRPNLGTEDLWAGRVKYVDLLQVRLQALGNDRYFYKHRAFEWEREFRLLVSLMQADEFTYQVVPDNGIELEVDLDALVERVMIGPELSKDEVEIIIEHTRMAGLEDRICKSSLLGEPKFF